MLGLFKKKTQSEKLQKKYEDLMRSWHETSKTNRAESDKIYMEAQSVLEQIETLKSTR